MKEGFITDYIVHHTIPVIEKGNINFVYRGKGTTVAIPGELNGWDPRDGMMQHVSGTDLYYCSYNVPKNGRVEYKIWVDSVWMLDPLNPRKAQGGFGENSDVWMPYYKPPAEIQFNPDIPHGSIDTYRQLVKYIRDNRKRYSDESGLIQEDLADLADPGYKEPVAA